MMELNILKGDMRHISFRDECFSFVYSYNAIFFMTKKDIATAMKEIERVLKPNGLCFVNFLSVDDPERNIFCKPFLENKGFSYHEDDEPEEYFRNFKIFHKEKRITRKIWKSKWLVQADMDYIAKKNGKSLLAD
jgi:ubiquinone/menaquinone biosynthesis C-methylase UbiE